MSNPSQEREVVDRYFNDYFEKENHLPRNERHRLVIDQDGKLSITKLSFIEGYLAKLSRSKTGQAIGLGALFSKLGIPDAGITRILIECRNIDVEKEKIQKLMDHFNQYHPDNPVTWKDIS